MLSTHGIRFVLSIFLARLLTPAEFGLIGMALVFVNLSQIFVDIGFGAALIQRKEADDLTYSSVFYYNLVVGLLLMVLFWFLAPMIGSFYENTEITTLVRYLAIGLPINAVTLVQVTILSREMRFKELSLRTFIAGIISGIIGVVMALTGFGVMALVVQYLLSSAISAIVIWNVSNWRPQWRFSWTSLREISAFSRYIFFGKSLDSITRQLDTLLVGKLFSASTLGFYSRAQSLNQFVIVYTSGSINKVFFPVLSQLQDQPELFKKVYLRTISSLALLTFFLSGIMIFSGEAIIVILFGEKWLPSVVIFQILALRIFNYPINAVIVKTFLALGKADENFGHGLVRTGIKMSTLIVGYYFGFDWFLYSMIITSYIGTLYNNAIVTRVINISFWQQVKEIYQYLLVLLIAAIPAAYLYLEIDIVFLRAVASVGVFSILYGVITYLLNPESSKWIYQQIKTVLKLK